MLVRKCSGPADSSELEKSMSDRQRESSAQPLEFQSATEMLSLLRARQIGAVELLKLHLERFEKYNPALNVVVATDVEGALRAATAADNTARDAAALPPLHGLPMTIKDTFEVVGMPATCGLPFLAEHRPQRDADAVARLKAAGAIVYGKTNVPAAAADWQSYNSIYGQSNNPWDTTRSPGGSSGGAAAAVAAGLAPLELGSDIGGSIRCPAHFCGVYGHKTSHGLVPGRGHIPPLPGQTQAHELGVFGPLVRSAKDLELALDILVAPGELQQPAVRITIPRSRHERLQDFRVAVWADSDTFAVDRLCLEAIESYVGDLRRVGVNVDFNARPDIDWHAAYETYLATLLPIVGSGLPVAVVQELLDAASVLPPDSTSYLARTARALTMRHFEYFNVREQREQLFRRWRDFFTRFDLLICPVMPNVAYPHDHRGEGAVDARSTLVDGRSRPYEDGFQWPALALVADLPSTAVPTGRFIDGLPMGVQVIGPYLEDRTPLRFAQLVERELGGFKAPTLQG
jgi:amidase